MNIREVIERLQQVAAELPAGLESEVRIHICNGHDTPGVMTASVQVDPVWVQHERTLEVKDSWAVVQGHPHLDEDTEGSTTRPLTMGLDEVVQQWAADLVGDAPRSVGNGRARDLDIVVDPDTGARFVVVHRPGQKSIKMELDDDGKIRYEPGAAHAVTEGCICDPGRNNRGSGAAIRDDDSVYIVKDGCPLHEWIDPPVEPG